jgi:hypothetical protein
VGDERRGDRGPLTAWPERDPAAAKSVELLGVRPAVLLGLVSDVHHALLCNLC